MKTKRLKVTMVCTAVCESYIDVPEDMHLDKAKELFEADIENRPKINFEYAADAEVLDVVFEEDNEEIKDFDADIGDEASRGVELLWDAFDEIARKHKFDLIVVDETVRDEERIQFGKPCSVLGSIATSKDNDLFTPVIRANVNIMEGTCYVVVIDRNGSFILNGRELERNRYDDNTDIEEFKEKVNAVFNRYKRYNSKNKVDI